MDRPQQSRGVATAPGVQRKAPMQLSSGRTSRKARGWRNNQKIAAQLTPVAGRGRFHRLALATGPDGKSHPRSIMDTITIGAWIGHLGRGLAPRELQCLLEVAQGFTTKEIAKHFGISESGVEKRIGDAMLKLKVARRAAMVAEAMRRQIISPLCIALAGLIAMHAVIDDSDPMRRDRRAPERRTAQVRIVRKAEAFEYHA